MKTADIQKKKDNGLISLKQDWREETNLGTKQSFNYHFGEYITYY